MDVEQNSLIYDRAPGVVGRWNRLGSGFGDSTMMRVSLVLIGDCNLRET